MTSSLDGTGPDTEPDLGIDTEPDLMAGEDEDTESDPARDTGQDEGWTDEGGATPSGPATADD